MSREDIYDILEELGGEAITRQIKLRAMEKFPGRTLYQYVTNRLKKLERKEHVTHTFKDGETIWKIIAHTLCRTLFYLCTNVFQIIW